MFRLIARLATVASIGLTAFYPAAAIIALVWYVLSIFAELEAADDAMDMAAREAYDRAIAREAK